MSKGNNMANPLTAYLERIEALNEQKKEIQDQVKEVYDEAAASGFDKKIMQEMVRLRKMDTEARREREDLRDAYINALDLV